MTEDEKKLGLDRIREWDRAEIEAAALLTSEEQAFLVELAAALDIRPGEPEHPETVIDLP